MVLELFLDAENGENSPATKTYIKHLRAYIDPFENPCSLAHSIDCSGKVIYNGTVGGYALVRTEIRLQTSRHEFRSVPLSSDEFPFRSSSSSHVPRKQKPTILET